MASFVGIARPYAQAAFEFARDAEVLQPWKEFLIAASHVMEDSTARALLKNPEMTAQKWLTLLEGMLQPWLDEHRQNFLRLLSEHQRFAALPAVAELYNIYFAQYVKESTVLVITAVDLDAAYKEKLKTSLSKRLSRDVIIQQKIDPNLLGGAIIHIGDRVIDGSIRGKLSRLLENLTG